ncbi:MAG: hypothetical protein EU547_06760 [Promethearchaeota archaeon]|nr:MAG: hypothetical protein EU547_06760 [Candidatus Lokiarchaeota archaeon]
MPTYWAPLLHLYQPPTQEPEVLRRINRECYKPLFEVIKTHKNAKFSLNINGVLIDLLNEYGMNATIDLLKEIWREGKVEILGTAKFHPILPLIPKKEVKRQIRLNEEINFKIFGKKWERLGFFCPEMAVSPNILEIIQEFGYKWTILSGVSCPNSWPYDKIYTFSDKLQLFFRDDILSNKISFKKINAEEFINEIQIMFLPKKVENNDEKDSPNTDIDKYVITAMDGETFGHHIKHYEKEFLGKALKLISKEKDIRLSFISNLDSHFPISQESIIPKPSSWSTNSEHLEKDIPYPLWKHSENRIHTFYWKIMKSLHKLMDLADDLKDSEVWNIKNYYQTGRWFYDKALHSCPLWWANPLNGTWSPNLIYKGVELIMKSALNAQLALVNAGIDDGEGYFDSISYYHGLLLMEIYSVSKKLC